MITPDQECAYPSLITALCERDPYTRGHCDRVCILALELAKALKLSESKLEDLRIASQLHDIGKIGIRDDIHLKPGSLTHNEWQQIKAHSINGERIIKETFLSNKEAVALIVRHHHESFDGSGYPDGLAGKEIPIGCRILLIVDAYDSLTTRRSYHLAHSHKDTMDILANEVETKFDPEIFAVFSKMISKSTSRASQ